MSGPAPARLLAVGASNLARLALPLLAAARASAGGPVEAHCALGRGRSYGLRSSLLGRGLPSIRASGLWTQLPQLVPAKTTALLLDVGNDLLYGVAPPQILAWVDEVLQRLAAAAERRVVVGLPVATIARLPAWRFQLVRRILVPSSRLTFAAAREGSEVLNAGLRTLASRHGATFAALPADWFGFDPVHVQRRHWRTAVRQWLDVPDDRSEPQPTVAGALAQWRFLGAAPHERSWFDRTTNTAQPVRSWRDGSTLSLW